MKGKDVLSVLFFAAAVLLSGCGEKIEPGNSEESYSKTVKAPLAVAKTGNKSFLHEAVGTIEARTSSTISSKLMGAVKAVHVREGDQIKKGDLLVEIDERQVVSQLKKAEAGLAEARRSLSSALSSRDSAKAGAELAQATYARYRELMEKESVSRQEFDEIEAKKRQAAAMLSQAAAMVEAVTHRVQQAEAAVESAKVSKKDASIRAPYDGEVTAKMVDEGDLASPGTPFLTLEREGVFCVSLVVPEKHIRQVSIGQKLEIKVPSMKDMTVMGTVGRIDPAADRKSRSFRVKVALPEDIKFNSGVFARVSIPVGEAGMVLMPVRAVIKRGQLTGCYLVDGKGIARFRLIRTGKTFGDSVEVLSGVKDNDRYVSDPPAEMEDGVKVEELL